MKGCQKGQRDCSSKTKMNVIGGIRMKCKKWLELVICMCFMVFLAGYSQKTVHAEPKAVDYLLPEAATRYYTSEEIAGMPLQVLCYAKNEIYARHGRKFQSQELTDYFRSQAWYYGKIEPGDFSESLLNDYEKANAALLSERENELQNGGYVLDEAGYDIEKANDYLYGNTFNIFDGIYVRDSHELSVLETDYFSVCLPGDIPWECMLMDQNTLSFYYEKAQTSGHGGKFLTIQAFDWGDNGYEDWPDWAIAGKDEQKKYIALLPTDLQYDINDPVQAEEYSVLLDYAKRCKEEDEHSIFIIK